MAIAASTAMMAMTEISSTSVKAGRRLLRERIMRASLFADAKLNLAEVSQVVGARRRVRHIHGPAWVRHDVAAADVKAADDRPIERDPAARVVVNGVGGRRVGVAGWVDARTEFFVGTRRDDLVAVAGVELYLRRAGGIRLEVRGEVRGRVVVVQQASAIEPGVARRADVSRVETGLGLRVLGRVAPPEAAAAAVGVGHAVGIDVRQKRGRACRRGAALVFERLDRELHERGVALDVVDAGWVRLVDAKALARAACLDAAQEEDDALIAFEFVEALE